VGVRNARDQQYEQINSVSVNELAESKRGLERKALEYERLKRGWSKDLTDQQREEIMVDFDSKYLDGLDNEEEFGGGEQEEQFDEEPLVEVTDEFGRTRKVKASRLQRPLTPEEKLRPYSSRLMIY
jgi:uncharacterized protein YecA (UPF0149 family)